MQLPIRPFSTVRRLLHRARIEAEALGLIAGSNGAAYTPPRVSYSPPAAPVTPPAAAPAPVAPATTVATEPAHVGGSTEAPLPAATLPAATQPAAAQPLEGQSASKEAVTVEAPASETAPTEAAHVKTAPVETAPGESATSDQKPADDLLEISGDNPAVRDHVIEKLKLIYDPEIPVNIHDLGLIYDIAVDDPGQNVHIRMTLTSPNCPEAEVIPPQVEASVRSIPGVATSKVSIVWDPPWGPDKMSEEARLLLNMY